MHLFAVVHAWDDSNSGQKSMVVDQEPKKEDFAGMDNTYNRVARRRRPGQSGFTLIELLVVIAVLAILALIVIFNVIGVANRGSKSACATDKQSVQTASDAFYNDTGGYPAAIGDLVPKYLHTAPSSTGAITFNSDGQGTITVANC